MKTITQELLKIDVFNDLSDEELKQIAKISRRKKFGIEELIFFQGEVPEYFYLLIDGIVKIYKIGPKNNEIVIHNFLGPILVAETASIDNTQFPSSCISLTQSDFVLIKKDQFLDILQSNVNIAFKVIQSLTKKLQSIEGLLNRHLILDATAKVASYIYDSPEAFKIKKNKVIATELHITPETLSRILKKFKCLNIVDNEHNVLEKSKLEPFLYD